MKVRHNLAFGTCKAWEFLDSNTAPIPVLGNLDTMFSICSFSLILFFTTWDPAMQLDPIIYALRMRPGRKAEETVTWFIDDWKKKIPFPQKIPKLIAFTFIPHQILYWLNQRERPVRSCVRYLSSWDNLISWENKIWMSKIFHEIQLQVTGIY